MTQSFLHSGDDAPELLKQSFICHAEYHIDYKAHPVVRFTTSQDC